MMGHGLLVCTRLASGQGLRAKNVMLQLQKCNATVTFLLIL